MCWLENTYMKLNTDKCHLIVSGYKFEQIFAHVGEDKIWERVDFKLLGVAIHKVLKFDKACLKDLL